MINYTKALAKDIESIGDRKIKTIFIGGGTPTYLSLQSWNNIYEALKKIIKENEYDFVGIVRSYDKTTGYAEIEQKNKTICPKPI